MLVLTRRLGERIVINEQVTIEIIDIRNNKVRLGIVAPKDISIHREEVLIKEKKIQNS